MGNFAKNIIAETFQHYIEELDILSSIMKNEDAPTLHWTTSTTIPIPGTN